MAVKDIVEEIISKRKTDGKKITKVDIANYLGISRQNLVNKFARDTFTPEELSKIAEVLGCKLVMKDSEAEYDIEYEKRA